MSNRLLKTLQSLLRESLNTPSDREWGTDSLVRIYKQSTPGQEDELDLPTTDEAWEKISTCQQCHAKLSAKDQSQGFRVCAVCAKRNHTSIWDNSADTDAVDEAGQTTNCAYEASDDLREDAEYEGRSVTLNKPFRTPDGPKKFAVYVKNENGNVIKLGFGDPNLSIKRDDAERRKNFLARHNCADPGPKWKAKYWSCKWGWGKEPISDKLKG